MKNVIDFLRRIKPRDEVIIIFNSDADGICSCILINKLLQKTVGKKGYIIPQPMPMEKNLLRKIKTTLPTKIIFLDLAIDQQYYILEKLRNICEILIIDHHQIAKNMNSKNIIHYNPRFKNPKLYQSTSYIVYKICSRIIDISNYLWIAAIGMIGDYNLEDSQDLVKEIKRKYSFENLQDSIVARLADMISSTKATKQLTCEEIVNIIDKMKNPDDISNVENGEKMINSFQNIENEIVSIMLDTEKNSEIIGDLILYRIKSNYNLCSPISTKLSEKYFNKFVIVYEKINGKIKLSARNQSRKYDVGKILKKATQELVASAGGHDIAAGATLNEKDWERFKENLISLLG